MCEEVLTTAVRVMNPNPFASLNQFTVPVATYCFFPRRAVFGLVALPAVTRPSVTFPFYYADITVGNWTPSAPSEASDVATRVASSTCNIVAATVATTFHRSPAACLTVRSCRYPLVLAAESRRRCAVEFRKRDDTVYTVCTVSGCVRQP